MSSELLPPNMQPILFGFLANFSLLSITISATCCECFVVVTNFLSLYPTCSIFGIECLTHKPPNVCPAVPFNQHTNLQTTNDDSIEMLTFVTLPPHRNLSRGGMCIHNKYKCLTGLVIQTLEHTYTLDPSNQIVARTKTHKHRDNLSNDDAQMLKSTPKPVIVHGSITRSTVSFSSAYRAVCVTFAWRSKRAREHEIVFVFTWWRNTIYSRYIYI